MKKPSHDVKGFNNTRSYRFCPIIYPRDRLNNNFVYADSTVRRYEPPWWHSQALSTPDDLMFLMNKTALKFTVQKP